MIAEQVKQWVAVGAVSSFPVNGGGCVLVQGTQIAVFNFDHREWYAVQNRCPHEGQEVISRGLIGDCKTEAKVACPLHKNAFSLVDGRHLGGNPEWKLKTYAVRVHGDAVEVFLEE